ncbi:hypothetical protein Q31a_00550 [Aureliella helgolandensis]|uniref:TupA-like ATPgrasp n=2 Tax=Aureliella helgolandensis TaxID=2527968 RepID=A0A518FZN3_9BACT|nr:hypothetical protein Q31a_00550 [Aureliella helgolandensis]
MQRRFRRKIGKSGNFTEPQTFPEKVQFRKLYGNHSTYARLADKYAVREYVAERVGERYLVPLLGVYDQLTPEHFRDLPDRFIIKANHGSKWHQVVWDKSQLDIASTVQYFNQLMHRTYGLRSHEYHYRLIRPRIVIEELLDDEHDSPVDYSFYSYHGPSGFDFLITLTAPRHETYAHFDRHWNFQDGDFTSEQHAKYVKPANYQDMFRVAEELSRGFDFLRVDLYNLNGRIYFGEATCTPTSGYTPAEVPSRGKLRGDKWHLDRDNPNLYRPTGLHRPTG